MPVLPDFPQDAAVGDQNLPASVTLLNGNSAGEGPLTICNAGDSGTCAGSEGIMLTPSCYELGSGSGCATPDGGVFHVDGPAIGAAATACAGTTFAVAVVNATTGIVRFTPSSGHVVLPSSGSTCEIGFTIDVLRLPSWDPSPSVGGLQTFQTAIAAGASGGIVTGSPGTDRVSIKAAPKIAGTPSPGVVLGGGIADAIALKEAFTPTTGNVTFQLYGPDACASGLASQAVVPINADGTAASPSFTPTAAGTYRWVPSYSGDPNNKGATGTCGEANQAVVTAPAASPLPCVDCDGDGFPAVIDCDDAVAAIHPGAADRPGNTIDEDCSGAAAGYPLLDSDIFYEFRRVGPRTTPTVLRVQRARAGSAIRLSCRGRGCTFKTKTRIVKTYTPNYDLTALVRRARLRPRAVLEIRVTKADAIGISRRFTTRAHMRPLRVDGCLTPGAARPTACPR